MPLRRTAPARALASSLTLGMLATRPASADPLAQVTIDYQAPSECPPEADLMAQLKRDLEGSQVSPEPLTVTIELAHGEGLLWRGSVRSRHAKGSGERTLSARDCTTLAEAVGLIVAMQIDPETAGSHARPRESSDAAPEKAPLADGPMSATPKTPPSHVPDSSHVTALPKPRNDSARGPRPSSSSRFPMLGAAALAWGAVDYGSLPSVTGAFGAGLGLTFGPGRLELGMGYYLPRSREFYSGGPEPASATFNLWEADARGCVSLWRNLKFAVGPCAGFQLARRRASAPSLADPQTIRTWDPTLLTGLDASYYLTQSLGIRTDLDFLWALDQPRFGFLSDGEPTEVFRPAKSQIRLRFGLDWRFF